MSMFAIAVAVAVSFFVLTVKQLRGIKDGFGLKTENYIVCAMLFVEIPVIIVLNRSTHPFYTDVFRFASGHVLYAMLMDYPLWRRHKASKWRRAPGSRRILKVLHDPDHISDVESFKEHLVREFSVEHLIFYYEADRFERVASGDHCEVDYGVDVEMDTTRNSSPICSSLDVTISALSQERPQYVARFEDTGSRGDYQEVLANLAMSIYCEYIDDNAVSKVR